MRVTIAAVYALLMFWGTRRYCRKIARKEGVEPVFATWLIMWVAVTMSFITYMKSGANSNILTNIANSVDVLAIWATFITLFAYRENADRQFSRLHKWCLGIAMLLIVLWLLLKQYGQVTFYASLSFQGVMIAAYIPTLHGLWTADKNTEDFRAWLLVWVAQFMALYPPLEQGDMLAVIYVIRAIAMVAIVLILIKRLEKRTKACSKGAPT